MKCICLIHQDTSSIKTTDPHQRMTTTNVKTYRFEFSKQFIGELSRFSKVHQYDERHTYKKEWDLWKSDAQIAEMMEMEKRRLEATGYIGNIEDKMFKSGRYYFRKKTTTTSAAFSASSASTPKVINTGDQDQDQDQEQETATTTPRPAATTSRKPYITMSKQCIKMMDDHIREHSRDPNFKPSSCYENFYNERLSSIEMVTEVGKIIEKYEKVRQNRQPLNIPLPSTDSNNAQTVEDITNDIMDKIKKTYKNRYYRFVNNTPATAAADE